MESVHESRDIDLYCYYLLSNYNVRICQMTANTNVPIPMSYIRYIY